MTQNIYDDPTFFAGYSRLERSIHGLEGAPEWPALRALLPVLHGAEVVDLGCGFGWFCRYAAEQGAARVLGLDVSENMLRRARADTTSPAVRYQRTDLEALDLPANSFDLAYSSLALHYVADLEALITRLRRALRRGGDLIVSVEHPIYTALSAPGWITGQDGRRSWPISRYADEGPRTTDWLAEGVVKYHRTIGRWLTMLRRHGFAVRHLDEWAPTDEQIAARPDLAEERDRPMFLLMAAKAA